MTDLLLEQVPPNPPTWASDDARLTSGTRLGSALCKLWARSARPQTSEVPKFASQPDRELSEDLPQFEPVVTDVADLQDEHPAPTAEPVPPVATEREQPASERRAHPRHESECGVWVTLRPPHLTGSSGIDGQADPGRIRGKVVDVSMGGFALRLMGAVVPGHRIWLSISNWHSAETLETAASVLRCTPQPDGDWHVVCRLGRRLTYEQVNFVGKQLFSSTLV